VTFVFNRVTQRSQGGDPIQRTTTVEANTAIIGRGTDCDLQLPDLSVGLRHAMITIKGRGRLEITAFGRMTFELNGRVVRMASLRISDRPELVFGSYLLTFALGRNDEVIVTVTQTEPLVEAPDATTVKRVFSLGPNLFSLRRAAWLFIVLIVGAGLALPISYAYVAPNDSRINPGDLWSPGRLSEGHHFLEHNCRACHSQALRAVPDDACQSCHLKGADRATFASNKSRVMRMGSAFPASIVLDHADPNLLLRATGRSFFSNNPVEAVFQAFTDHPTDHCIGCHTDHVGTAGQIPAFEMPASPTPRQVTGGNCVNCHGTLKAHISETVLADVPDWDHHPDYRPRIASLFVPGHPRDVNDAVSDGSFDTGLRFSHRQHLANDSAIATEARNANLPRGADGRLSCAACHQPADDGRGFVAIDMKRNCAACHSLAIPGPNGGTLMLAHGKPDQVVAQLRTFYEAGGAPPPVFRRERPGSWDGTGFGTGPKIPPEQVIVQKIRQEFTTPQGKCFTCHAFRPNASDSTVFRIVGVHLVDRYLPLAGFDHSVPAHHLGSDGAPDCMQCHAVKSATSLAAVEIPGIGECKTCHGSATASVDRSAAATCTECHGYHKGDMGVPPSHEAFRKPWGIPDGT
jgi:hypothetical protein